MKYILTQEEFDNVVSKEKFDEINYQLMLVIHTLRNNDFCLQYRYNGSAYCDSCPIASINLKFPEGKHFAPCPHQKFSK